ncbi:MAG TPA: hypothetical protein VJK26_02435 [Patescibacteria group bacterium]|nr:hypothetical protein [Patescibacteria group bacterium]
MLQLIAAILMWIVLILAFFSFLFGLFFLVDALESSRHRDLSGKGPEFLKLAKKEKVIALKFFGFALASLTITLFIRWVRG